MPPGSAAGIDDRPPSRKQPRGLLGLWRSGARDDQVVRPRKGCVDRPVRNGYHSGVRRLAPALILLALAVPGTAQAATRQLRKIGRASCRERGEMSGGGGALKKK